ncbi:EGF-like domain-containing protein 1 isoform X1 [Gigantopelta aegis]|uniref:EGF-like domain-containing protein 1 isoform X1 n=1 Tax=Gigantopelta aegis TaxID=1735272 RepID=UPI001B88A588|nr:EGF-like domain-containing protein 1 isoform X1 [Gigantopelta aegis]
MVSVCNIVTMQSLVVLFAVFAAVGGQPSGTFNCKREGSPCMNGKTCKVDGTCDCGTDYIGYNCDVPIDKKEQSPCAASGDQCGTHGFCYTDTPGTTANCFCDVGWGPESRTDETCTAGRYKVVCFKDKMMINIYPYSPLSPTSRIYLWDTPLCKISDDYNTMSVDQQAFVGGRAREIDHDSDAVCGSATMVDDAAGKITFKRVFYVGYNTDYSSSLDEILTAVCEIDKENQQVTSSIEMKSLAKDELLDSDTTDELLPVSLNIEAAGSPLSQGATVDVGQTLSFTFSVDSTFNAMLLDGVKIENGKLSSDADFQSFTLLDTGCRVGSTHSDIWVDLPKGANPLIVDFEFKAFIFTKSTMLKVIFSIKVCLNAGDAVCTHVDCNGAVSAGRRKRDLIDTTNQTTVLERTFYVTYPDILELQNVTNTDGLLGKLECETSVAMIGGLGALALVVILLLLVLFIQWRDHSSKHSKQINLPYLPSTRPL